MPRFITVIYIVVSFVCITETTRCFECRDITHLEACAFITQCHSNETCYVEQIVNDVTGQVRYNSGCRSRESCSKLSGRSIESTRTGDQTGTVVRRSDSLGCQECCQGDYCNNKGCNDTSTPPNQRGPYCLACLAQNDPQSCRQVKQCGVNQVCAIYHQLRNSVYVSECMTQTQCNAIQRIYSMIGKRSPEVVSMEDHVFSKKGEINRDQDRITSRSNRVVTINHCPKCCEKDFCNDNCLNEVKDFL